MQMTANLLDFARRTYRMAEHPAGPDRATYREAAWLDGFYAI